MQEKLVEFANLLRENGVRVSLAETLDAFSASEVTGLSERDAFRGREAIFAVEDHAVTGVEQDYR